MSRVPVDHDRHGGRQRVARSPGGAQVSDSVSREQAKILVAEAKTRMETKRAAKIKARDAFNRASSEYQSAIEAFAAAQGMLAAVISNEQHGSGR